MATIGTFTHDGDGVLNGSIRTLTLDTPAQLEPVTSETEGAPAYRLYAGEIELGAAWAKTAKESGRVYLQVRLDDPSLPGPIFANLIPNVAEGTYTLIWNRPKALQRTEDRHVTEQSRDIRRTAPSNRNRRA
jgi:uncharacterized protein (DUF736 family)